MINFDFSGQVALVTGGRRGIGAAIVHNLLACGAHVIFTGTEELSKDSIQAEFGPDAECWAVDFCSDDSTQQFLSRLRTLPRLDILINNAGLARHSNLSDATLKDWETTQRVNLTAPFLTTQAAAELMKSRKYGRIVNIGSILGHIGRAEKGAYSAAKTGLIGLTRVSAVELAKSGVIVNQVSPGLTSTELLRKSYSAEHLAKLSGQTPLGRIADPDEIARVVLFLCSQHNSYMLGQTVVVDGGASVV